MVPSLAALIRLVAADDPKIVALDGWHNDETPTTGTTSPAPATSSGASWRPPGPPPEFRDSHFFA